MAKKKSGKKAKARSKSQARRIAAQEESVAQHATESDVAGELPSDEDGYLIPPDAEAEEAPAVVVADYSAGGEIAEPTKVLKISNDRRARKAEQRANLEK